jgi:hypothetical protein
MTFKKRIVASNENQKREEAIFSIVSGNEINSSRYRIKSF